MLYDNLELRPHPISKDRIAKIQDQLDNKKATTLDIIASVSYAGWRTGNRMMYLPTDFQKNVVYWTKPNPKPVQVHHMDHQDAIGRNVSAKYVDTSAPYQSNPLIMKFLSPDTPLSERLDLTDAVVALQGSVEDYEGLGHIRVHAQIMDPDAIQKVLDGRYLTISSGYHPSHVYCNICHQDVRTSDECEHIPGKIDEETGRLCLYIPVDQRWEEWSFVNIPAIELCKTQKTGEASLDKKFAELDKDVLIKRTDSYALYRSEDMVVSLHSDDEWAVNDSMQDIADAFEKPSKDKTDVKSVIAGEEGTVTDELEMFEQLCDYRYLALELEEMGFNDATLSSAQRKKLASKSFCGPDRSFPVPDCAHVRAARRLIGRYKGPGDKTRILGCVNKKAKALGCDKGKDMLEAGEGSMGAFLKSMMDTKSNYELLIEFIPEANRLDEAGLTALEDKVFLGQNRTYPAQDKIHLDACKKLMEKFGDEKDSSPYKLTLELITQRDETLNAAPAQEPAKQEPAPVPAPVVENKELDALKQELDTKTKEFNIEIGIYQKKIDSLKKEIADLEAVNQTMAQDLRDLLVTTIGELQKLQGSEPTKADELKTKSNDELKTVIKTIKDSKPVTPAAQPEPSKVENPVLPTSVPTPKDAKVKEARAKFGLIAKQYDDLKQFKGDVFAKSFLAKMIKDGYLEAGTAFEVE